MSAPLTVCLFIFFFFFFRLVLVFIVLFCFVLFLGKVEGVPGLWNFCDNVRRLVVALGPLQYLPRLPSDYPLSVSLRHIEERLREEKCARRL